jgi:glycerol-3-phosphate dehydrogenase
VYAGLRPLLSGESEATSKLSREHQVSTPVPGLVVIAGGKYTTYRVMAADALDAAAKGLGGQVPASTTDRLPLLGAEGYHALVNGKDRLARTSGLAVATIEHLLGRYGSLTLDLLALVADRPELGEPLIGAEEYLAAEVVYAAAAEGALHLEDILTRRTRISIETSDRGVKAARAAAELVAPTLGWDSVRLDGEVDHYLARVAAERESQETADDRSADATRLGAPDIVALRPLGPAV